MAALTWGDNLMQAYYRMETTEYYAKILMMNNFILGKKTLLSQGQIDDIIKIRAGWGITTGGDPSDRRARRIWRISASPGSGDCFSGHISAIARIRKLMIEGHVRDFCESSLQQGLLLCFICVIA